MSAMEDLKNATPEQVDQQVAVAQDEDYERAKAKMRRARRAKRELDAEENPPRPIPKPRTLQDRLANKTKTIGYRVAELMKYGHRVLLVAQFKSGKTTMVINFVRCLVDNRQFLNRFRVVQVSDVTIIDAEMATEDTNQLDEWYEQARIKNADRIKIVALRGAASSFNILDPQVRTLWADNLRGTKFLVLDCLRPILDAIGLDEKNETGKFFTAFDELLKEAGIPEAMVVTHMGHQNERARGDSRNLDWPDATWNLVRLNEDPSSKRFFKAFGRGVDLRETALDFDANTLQLSLGSGTRGDEKALSAIPLVIRFVETFGGRPTQTQIRAGVRSEGMGDQSIRKAIRVAVKNGQLLEMPGTKKGSYVYEVAPPAPPPPDDPF